MTGDLDENERCAFQTYPGRRHLDPEPPEYCDEPVVCGTEYCPLHQEEKL